MVIRTYRPEDREVLKDITTRSFQSVTIEHDIEARFGLTNGKDWAYRKRKHIDEDCSANPDGVFVAEIDGRVVGYITTLIEHDTLIGRIPNVAVDTGFHGRGIGRKLIEAALAYFRQQGMAYAKIETLEQNQVGRHLYPSLGFKEVSRQIHYFMEL